MKTTFAAVLASCLSIAANAQIQNPGFEATQDTAASLPRSWKARNGHGYLFALDDQVRHSGARSLRITYTEDSSAPAFAPFSQLVSIQNPGLKKIVVSVWVRMEAVTGNGGLWCQVWDEHSQQIGFKNLEQQDVFLKGSSDWAKYSMNLTVTPDARKLLLGGYLGKGGTIWYDDFELAEAAAGSDAPSKEARTYIGKFRDIVKTRSIYSDLISWDSLDRELEVVSSGAKTYADAAESGNYMLNKLRSKGDNHSFVMSASQSKQNEAENLDGRQPFSKRIDAHTGYIAVPGFMSINKAAMEAFASSIQSQIRALDSAQPVTRWIVDLRENTGGNMYPMIAGLGPLIGDGDAGFFIKRKGRQAWFYKAGRCGVGKGTAVRLGNPYKLRQPDSLKIAVLIGGRTSSSGEMTTVSFIGKPNTRLFGQATGGYTTGNSMHKLPGGSLLLLASSYVADRNGNAYKGQILPDVVVAENDDPLDAAISWFDQP